MLSFAKNIEYVRWGKKVTNSIGGQFTPLIRNVLAVVFGANSMEYKFIETIRI